MSIRVIKFSQVIRCVSFKVNSNLLKPSSVSIFRLSTCMPKSHYHSSQKQAVLTTLINWTKTVCDRKSQCRNLTFKGGFQTKWIQWIKFKQCCASWIQVKHRKKNNQLNWQLYHSNGVHERFSNCGTGTPWGTRDAYQQYHKAPFLYVLKAVIKYDLWASLCHKPF